MTDEVRFCHQCGAAIPPDAQVCPRCDTPVRSFITRPPVAPARSNQSFSERYRGTPYGDPAPPSEAPRGTSPAGGSVPAGTPPPGDPAPGGQAPSGQAPSGPQGAVGGLRGGRLLLVLGAVGVLVVAGALAYLSANGGLNARPTAPPVATNPTPSPTVGPGTAATNGFLALIQQADLSYHVVYKATTTAQGHVVRATVTMDVSGADYRLSESGGGYGTDEIAFVGGTLYQKLPGKAWARVPGGAPFTFSPFLDISGGADISYVGPATVGGQQLLDLQTTGWYRTKSEKWVDLAYLPLPPNEYTLDVYVTPDGTPVAAKFTMQVNGPVGEPPLMTGSTEFTFTAVGTTPKITAPIR